MFNTDDKKPIQIGLLAGFIASLCCVGPLMFIVFGIGGASTALAIGKQSPYFFAFGILVLVVGLGLHYIRKSKKGCRACEIEQLNWKKTVAIILLACVAFFIVYYILLFVLVPWLAPLIYQNFYHSSHS